jgi:hypothetical protein
VSILFFHEYYSLYNTYPIYCVGFMYLFSLTPAYVVPRRRWVDNIKMDLREIGWDGGDRIDRAQDRDQWRALVRAVMNLRVP